MAASMREQDRHGHVLEDVTGSTADEHLAQAGVAVATHDQKFGGHLAGLGEKDVGHTGAAAGDQPHFGLDRVPTQVRHELFAGPAAGAAADVASIDNEDENEFGGVQERDRVRGRTGRFARAVPGDQCPPRRQGAGPAGGITRAG